MHRASVRRLAELACYREGINAHLTAAIEMAEISPGGLMMPNQALLYTGRVLACSAAAGDDASRPRPLRRAAVRDAQTPPPSPLPRRPSGSRSTWRSASSTRRTAGGLFAFARDLLNSDYAGHRLTFQLFAQSPQFAHLLAVYNNYDFEGPADLVRRYAHLGEPVLDTGRTAADSSASTTP